MDTGARFQTECVWEPSILTRGPTHRYFHVTCTMSEDRLSYQLTTDEVELRGAEQQLAFDHLVDSGGADASKLDLSLAAKILQYGGFRPSELRGSSTRVAPICHAALNSYLVPAPGSGDPIDAGFVFLMPEANKVSEGRCTCWQTGLLTSCTAYMPTAERSSGFTCEAAGSLGTLGQHGLESASVRFKCDGAHGSDDHTVAIV